MARLKIAAVVIAAMPEEAAPVVAELERVSGATAELFDAPVPAAWTITPRGTGVGTTGVDTAVIGAAGIRTTATRTADATATPSTALLPGTILVMQTGIGLAGTAAALGWLFARTKPRFVISAGTTGGLAKGMTVGTLVAGTSYAYGAADATAFGYVRGQIPGRPASFPGSEALLAALPKDVQRGQMLSGDSFVTAKNVGDMRTAFPDALSTDMESTAAAQAAWQFGIPFISLRSASDLCGPEAGQDFHMDAARAAELSARAVVETIINCHSGATPGKSPRFDDAALRASLLYVFGEVKNVEGDPEAVPEELTHAVRAQCRGLDVAHEATILRRVAGALAAITADSTVTLTAKQYDSTRARLVGARGLASGRGKLAWPPTSQTIIKRSGGYWNDALTSIGLSVKSGRKRGGLRFDAADYVNAVRAYVRAANRAGRTASFNGYQSWAHQPENRGVFPSGAAVRQNFGSWSGALSAVRDGE